MTPLQHGRKGESARQVAAAWLRRALSPVQRFARQLHGSLRPVLKRIGHPLQIVAHYMPKGLYPRALVIVIAPVVLLQSVIAYVFMERHWQTVTQRLSSAVSADIAMLIDVYESYPQDADTTTLSRIPTCRRRGRAPSSRCSTTRYRPSSASRLHAPSGSTPSAAPA